jgi:pimeloyl-ACP methyl ester carboxylesterase
MIEAVEIPAADGTMLRGQLRRGGGAWIVLAHDVGGDLDLWEPLARPLAGKGVSVLAIDLRGHGGSDGDPLDHGTAQDLEDVIGYARAAGADCVIVGAAGAAVEPALEAAADAAGFVAVAPKGREFDRGPAAKLVLVASLDRDQATAGSALQRTAGSATVVSLPLAGGSAEILSGAWRTNVQAYVLGFVREAARRATGARL